jgi:elongation factor Ts
MRIKGLAKADKRAERETRAGLVDAYVHSDRIGVLVEVNCETDFVARNQIFKDLVHNIALHVAASAPLYVFVNDIPTDVLAKEKALIMEELKTGGKPTAVLEKIAEGKLAKYYDQVCLLNQPYIKNPDQSVGDFIKANIAKLGENIVVRRFKRIALGEINDG